MARKYKVYVDSRKEYPTKAQIGTTVIEPSSGNRWTTKTRPWRSSSTKKIIITADSQMEAARKALRRNK